MAVKIEFNVGDEFWALLVSGAMPMAITHELYEVTRVNGSSVYGVSVVKVVRGEYIEERREKEVRFDLRTLKSPKDFWGTRHVMVNDDGTLYWDENY